MINIIQRVGAPLLHAAAIVGIAGVTYLDPRLGFSLACAYGTAVAGNAILNRLPPWKEQAAPIVVPPAGDPFVPPIGGDDSDDNAAAPALDEDLANNGDLQPPEFGDGLGQNAVLDGDESESEEDQKQSSMVTGPLLGNNQLFVIGSAADNIFGHHAPIADDDANPLRLSPQQLHEQRLIAESFALRRRKHAEDRKDDYKSSNTAPQIPVEPSRTSLPSAFSIVEPAENTDCPLTGEAIPAEYRVVIRETAYDVRMFACAMLTFDTLKNPATRTELTMAELIKVANALHLDATDFSDLWMEDVEETNRFFERSTHARHQALQADPEYQRISQALLGINLPLSEFNELTRELENISKEYTPSRVFASADARRQRFATMIALRGLSDPFVQTMGEEMVKSGMLKEIPRLD